MRQQHFLPLLKSCSYPHLLLPQARSHDPHLDLRPWSQNVSPMARNPSMSPLLQVGTSTSEVSGHAQTLGRHRETAPSPCKSQKAQLKFFFFGIEM